MATLTGNAILAKPPGDCCIEATLHSGTPRGTFTTISGVPTYLTQPTTTPSNGNIILYFPDIFGLFTNSLLVMDAFSNAGYTVLGIDYFRGDPYDGKGKNDKANPDFDFATWKAKHSGFADEAVPKWVKAAKEQYGKPETKIACVGYCFGAPYVMNELAGETVTAGAFAHPTTLKEHEFFNVKKPLFMSCAENDLAFPAASRTRALEIFAETKVPYHFQLFQGVAHGFAIKGDMSKPYERYAKEQSLKGITEWFDFWLSQ